MCVWTPRCIYIYIYIYNVSVPGPQPRAHIPITLIDQNLSTFSTQKRKSNKRPSELFSLSFHSRLLIVTGHHMIPTYVHRILRNIDHLAGFDEQSIEKTTEKCSVRFRLGSKKKKRPTDRPKPTDTFDKNTKNRLNHFRDRFTVT